MQYTINQLYDLLKSKVNDTYEVFKGFFGEPNVDIQAKRGDSLIITELEELLRLWHTQVTDNDNKYEVNDGILADLENHFENERYFIYVWWNSVTITNENDKSVDIQDLYAKVEIQINGRIPYENTGFLLNRSTYTEKQFLSGFLHSHIHYIPKNEFSKFQIPCLGTGPINNTIATLKNEYDVAEWMLFCQELSMYVTVESLAGVPWNYLEKIGKESLCDSYSRIYDFSNANNNLFMNNFSRQDLRNFIEYYLEHGHLSLSYVNGKFVSGMPYYEYIIDVSNAFIDFYNKNLKTVGSKRNMCSMSHLLNEVIIANGKFYSPHKTDISRYDLERYNGKFVLNFKGKPVYTHIIHEKDEDDSNRATVLNNNVAMYILRNILRTINFKYRNEHYHKTRDSEAPASASQRVFYI